jgi:two-component system phosphate regulon sensor histidine kinase PhoR
MMQFKFHVKQVIGNVADKLQKQEAYSFYDKYNRIKIVLVKFQKDLMGFYYFKNTKQIKQSFIQIVLYQKIIISSSFFNKNSIMKI